MGAESSGRAKAPAQSIHASHPRPIPNSLRPTNGGPGTRIAAPERVRLLSKALTDAMIRAPAICFRRPRHKEVFTLLAVACRRRAGRAVDTIPGPPRLAPTGAFARAFA
jgi:hypothetical protein